MLPEPRRPSSKLPTGVGRLVTLLRAALVAATACAGGGRPEQGGSTAPTAGSGNAVDRSGKRVVGDLVASGKDTGVDLAHPERTSALVVDIVRQYVDAWTHSPGLAAFTAQQMRGLGLVANGTNRTLGDFESGRVRKLIDISLPVYAAQHKTLKADLRPDDLVTNEFVDRPSACPRPSELFRRIRCQ